MYLTMRFVSDSDEWDMSERFHLHREDFIQELVLSNDKEQRLLYVSMTAAPKEPLKVTFSPPILLANLSVFPLQFRYQPSKFSEITGSVPASSLKHIYCDSDGALMLHIDGWDLLPDDKGVQLGPVTHSTIKNERETESEEGAFKELIALSCFNKAALKSGLGRVIYINSTFLFINDTDLLLFVKQRGSKNVVRLDPKASTPFSWAPGVGPRQIHLRVGSTDWSNPFAITQPAVTKLSISILDLNLVYDLMMEVKQADAYSRVVVIKPWLHFVNRVHHSFLV